MNYFATFLAVNFRQSCNANKVAREAVLFPAGDSLCSFYGQLTRQHSLRDLVTALNASLHKLQHVGLRAVRRSTLADANSKRSHEIFRELSFARYGRYCQQAPSHGFQVRHKLYSLDAKVIDLCLKSV